MCIEVISFHMVRDRVSYFSSVQAILADLCTSRIYFSLHPILLKELWDLQTHAAVCNCT